MYIEADFLREYGIDLEEKVAAMTWRKFLVLVRGLSPHSATVTAITSRIELGPRDPKKRDQTVLVSGDKAVDQAFVSMFGRTS